MDIISNDISVDSILEYLPKDNSQNSNQDKEVEVDLQYCDNAYIDRELINNANLEHKNLLREMNFGINRNLCGPFFFSVEFNSKYFMNIIREYYLKLNCQRLNFIVSDAIIYIYGYYDQNLKIYTKINTNYIYSDLVNIIEGHSKSFRANFDVLTLLKSLEEHNFTNKEMMKISFVFNQNQSNKSKKQNIDSVNPFAEIAPQKLKFESEFNFDDSAIPGCIIIETQKYRCKVESNFAPLELSSPPKIPLSVFTDYILSISIDKLNSIIPKIDPLNPLQIYCNHYLCNFIHNVNVVNVENFLTYENSEEIEFKYQKAINFCKKFDEGIDESNFYQKMINFTLKKHELDALKILNKKSSIIYFYAGKKEKYYFTKETNQEGNIASAIILCSENNNQPLISNIEDCCTFSDHWAEWINHLGTILPKDCIAELKKKRKFKDQSSNNNNNDEISANNKKNRKRIKVEKKNDYSNNSIKNSIANSTDEFTGLNLYANNKKGNLKIINIEENLNNISIKDKGRGGNKNQNNNDDDNDDEEKNDENNNVNPFNPLG